MPFERPTFHEAWYRVEGLHPRLRSTVQISRQHFRGQPWYVVQDHTNNMFVRLTEPAYVLLGLLDGRRTVGEAWKIAMDRLGDDAPTQPETIQLLGQLYTSNLLQAELAADAHGLFNRYKKRRQREIQSYLMNLMFIRLPLIDPDAFMERWMPAFGWVFSKVGAAVWAVILAIGMYFLTSKTGWSRAIFSEGQSIMAPENLIPLYFCFAATKACHEFGHAISCKKFGMTSGVGGEVHAMGIMFLVFSPVPYVDASSSWALQNKWQRIVVAAAGMWVELAIAAFAAVVWSQTPDKSPVHQLAYNVMFIASFSTVVFNANPLLRYDGYYILSDLLEIANLAQRSKELWFYLVKRFAWGVKQARNPAYSRGEEIWMFFYGIAAFIMRVVVSVGIMLYLATKLSQWFLIVIAMAMGIAGLITWVFMPIGKFVHYLLTSPELMRVRTRALVTTGLFVAGAVYGVGIFHFPDRARAQGIADADATGDAAFRELNPEGDGFVEKVFMPGAGAKRDALTGQFVLARGTPILTAQNEELDASIRGQECDIEGAQIRLREARSQAALATDPARRNEALGYTQALEKQLVELQEHLRQDREKRDRLTMRANMTGALVIPDLEHMKGSWVRQGEKVGYMVDMNRIVVIATVPNEYSAQLRREAEHRVEIRVKGQPDRVYGGTFSEADVSPAGRTQLRSKALGYLGGGMTPVTGTDREGVQAAQPIFEVRIHLDPVEPGAQLMPGERVMVRFEFAKKSLVQQGYTKLMRLLQSRFGM